MSLYLLTTEFPDGLLESGDLVDKAGTARSAYRGAAPSFVIVASYKVSNDTTIDIVEADSDAEADAAAKAIADATGTRTDVAGITRYNSHLAALESGQA